MVGYSRSSYDLYIWLSMDRLLPIDYRLCIPEIELKPGNLGAVAYITIT